MMFSVRGRTEPETAFVQPEQYFGPATNEFFRAARLQRKAGLSMSLFWSRRCFGARNIYQGGGDPLRPGARRID